MWRGDEETHEARRAARSTHGLRGGAERGRGVAKEGQREGRCDMGAATRKRTRHGARRGLLTSCESAPSGDEGMQRRGGRERRCDIARRVRNT